MRELKKTPARVVENGRVVEWGVFDTPFRDMNILDTRLPGVPEALTRYRLKEWQHFAIVGDDFLFAFVLLSSHYLGTSFCYFVDRTTGTMSEHHLEVPGNATQVARELWRGDCRFARRGYRVEVHNRLEAGLHSARIDIAARRGLPAIAAEIEMLADLGTIQPLIVVLPISENRPLHTHKMLCPVRGEIRVGERKIELDETRHQVLVDVQKTFYPLDTTWRWATFAGRDDEGKLLGINLVQNMIRDDERYNENAFWHDGKQSLLGAARFTHDEENVLAPWTVKTTDERCSLTFTPEGERAGKVNLLLVKSDYHQPYGRFNGTIVDADDREHVIRDAVGVTEYHKARF